MVTREASQRSPPQDVFLLSILSTGVGQSIKWRRCVVDVLLDNAQDSDLSIQHRRRCRGRDRLGMQEFVESNEGCVGGGAPAAAAVEPKVEEKEAVQEDTDESGSEAMFGLFD